MEFGKDIVIFTTIILLVLITRRITLYFINYTKKNLPPGPWSLPIIGNLSFIGVKDVNDIYRQFSSLEKKYGPIFSIKAGQQLCIILSSPKAVKETFIKNKFINRVHNQHILEYRSVFLETGEIRSQHRRYIAQCLQELCVRRTHVQEQIIIQGEKLVSRLKNHGGIPINIAEELFIFASGSISQICFGKNLNSECKTALNKRMQIVTVLMENNFTQIFCPWWRDIFAAKRKRHELHEICRNVEKNYSSVISDRINEQRASSNFSENCDNFLHMYLSEIEQNGKGSKYNFNEIFLIRYMFPIYMGGHTVVQFLELCFCLLAAKPDIQSKIQNEIDCVIGSKTVEFSDRHNMPYTQSVLLEVVRLKDGVIFPRRLSEDTRIMGYDIPKNAIVIANAFTMHRDGNHWENPYDFWPERYLNSQNSQSMRKPSYIFTFSYGKRRCPGEIVAQMQLFLCLVCVLQTFDVQPAKENSADFDNSLFGSFKPQELRFFPRKVNYSDV